MRYTIEVDWDSLSTQEERNRGKHRWEATISFVFPGEVRLIEEKQRALVDAIIPPGDFMWRTLIQESDHEWYCLYGYDSGD